MTKLRGIIYTIIAILIIIGIVLFVTKPTGSLIPLSNAFVVQLTDPPQVPVGTQALIMSYSNIRLHKMGAPNSTGFVDINQKGTVNLLDLINFTQTIGVAKVNPNSSFNFVRFNITSAKIEIDNISYNVSVPNNMLTVHISNVNSSAKGVVIEITPSILEIYSANQTIFVMVPSAKAVVIGGTLVNRSVARVGYKARKRQYVMRNLESIKPNISIVSASLSFSGNTTSLSVEVKNNGNNTVKLRNVFVFGYMKMLSSNSNALRKMNPQMPSSFNGGVDASSDFGNPNSFNVSRLENAVAIISGMENNNTGLKFNMSNLSHAGMSFPNANVTSINITEVRKMIKMYKSNYSSLINSFSNISGIAIGNISSVSLHRNEVNAIIAKTLNEMENAKTTHMNKSEILKLVGNMSIQIRNLRNQDISNMEGAALYNHYYHRVLNFIVMRNGSLALPFYLHEVMGLNNGYTLKGGSIVTLKFSGPIVFGRNHMMPAPHINIITLPIKNQSYSIRVIGERGAFAETNVTAT